jgi:hypothetical protein
MNESLVQQSENKKLNMDNGKWKIENKKIK